VGSSFVKTIGSQSSTSAQISQKGAGGAELSLRLLLDLRARSKRVHLNLKKHLNHLSELDRLHHTDQLENPEPSAMADSCSFSWLLDAL